MTRRSITGRLLTLVVITTVVVAGVAGVLSYRLAFDRAQALQDDVLVQVATLAASAGSGPLTTDGGSLSTDAADIDVTTLAASGLPASTAAGLLTTQMSGAAHRVAVVVPEHAPAVVASQSVATRDRIARDAAFSAVLPLLLLLPVLLWALVWATRRGLAPLGSLVSEIRQRGADDLRPLDLTHAPEELRAFVGALNAQFARAELARQRERTFIGQAAHELRTPLTAVALQLDRAATASTDAQRTERLDDLRRGVDRSRHVVEQLLDLARAQGRTEPTPHHEPFDVVLRAVLTELLPTADAHGVEFNVDTAAAHEASVPSAATYSCLRNLIDNAIRHGGRGTVEITAGQDRGRMWVVVHDEGPGIESLDDLRQPFVQGRNAVAGGSGLGLAIVSAQLDQVGGTLSLDSDHRPGARMTLTLPVDNLGPPSGGHF